MNELGISREDIQIWIKEAIEEEAKRYVAQTYEKTNIEETIRKIINKMLTTGFWNDGKFKDEVYKELVKHVLTTHSLTITPKE